jgi:hypothetical protein
VVKEVDVFLSRPKLALTPQHFAVCFLNQIILSNRDSELSRLLVVIYFSLFRKLTNEKLIFSG